MTLVPKIDISDVLEFIKTKQEPEKIAIYHSLPAIDIAVTIGPRLFLDRMAGLAEADTNYSIEKHYDALGKEGYDFVNLRWLGEFQDAEAGAQLIARPDVLGRIAVELYVPPCQPDPPTRESYCKFADITARPLLRKYNKVFGTRYRLRIQPVNRKKFALPPHSDFLLKRFTTLANVRSLHYCDLQRFYAFVRNSRTEVPEGAIRTILIDEGFPRTQADYFPDLYHHLWAYKRYDKREFY